MERTVTDTIKVSANIGLLNQYINKAKKVAVSSIHPVFGEEDRNFVRGFKLNLEGPPQHISYLNRLLSDAGIKIS